MPNKNVKSKTTHRSGGGRSSAPVKRSASGRAPAHSSHGKSHLARNIVIAVLIVVLLAGIGVGGYFLYRKISADATSEIVATVDGVAYTKDVGGIVITNGKEISLATRGKGGEITAKIVAADDAEFEFKLGREIHAWSEHAGEDFTAGFTITPTAHGITIGFEGLKNILAKTFENGDITLNNEEKISGDVFTLILTNSGDELRIGFKTYVPVGGIDVTPPGTEY